MTPCGGPQDGLHQHRRIGEIHGLDTAGATVLLASPIAEMGSKTIACVRRVNAPPPQLLVDEFSGSDRSLACIQAFTCCVSDQA